jgi:putative PIN family toxin of toxin-antitoxin system
MRVNRFVLDVNIYISYFITKSEHILLRIIKENKIAIFSCEELFVELIRVLNYPHLKKYKVDVHQVILIVKSVTVYRNLIYPIKNYLPQDEADNYIIALALQTNSGFVTSGDKHILSERENLEKKYKKLQIITKSYFEGMFIVKGLTAGD